MAEQALKYRALSLLDDPVSQLNPPQQAAVNYIDGPLLVLAGAGSGKTRVITQKIAWMIRNCGRQAKHIAAVTFTNKAAREMKERVGQLLEGNEARGLQVSTFHNLGLRIMTREYKRIGYRSGFSIFDAQDAQALIKELMHKENLADDDDVQQVAWKISAWKNALLTPAAAKSSAEDEFEERAAAYYQRYQRALKAYNALDFDDLILQPVLLFREDAEALEAWQNRIHYLLVDEYQDTNECQYELVRQLVGMRGSFTVVGDDDQSIYAWRGARPENLARLQDDFPGLRVIKLEQNYRSMGRILKAANQVIANNPHVFDKRLWSELGFGDMMRVLVCRDEEHEAQRVVSEILHHRFTHRTPLKEFAILYRGNHQARVFEKALREANLPYFMSGGQSFFSRAEIKDVMSYLKLLANPDDDAAFLRIINTPRREIGPNTLEKLANYASDREVSLLRASRELGLEQHLGKRPLENLRRFAHWFDDVQERATREDPVILARAMVREIDYEGWLIDTCKSQGTAERRMKNVDDLVDWLGKIRESDADKDNLPAMVAHLSLMDILERGDEEDSGDRINMLTLHASKGLEYPHVFMVGMEEELLPHRSSLEEDNVEEERRLAYVGITRAQRSLIFTMARKRRRFGETVSCEPSRFLNEIPEDDLEWEGPKGDGNPERSKQRGQAHLANLKSLLD